MIKILLADRLSKLHQDAQCCATGFAQSQRELTQNPEFERCLKILHALADETRLAMIKLVQRYERLCACEIECAFKLSHSTIIHHLNLLVEAQILSTDREGKWTYFQLANDYSAIQQELCEYLSDAGGQPVFCCCVPDSTSERRDSFER